MNKFDLINNVLISKLASQDKCLLIELITRSDDSGLSWPSVERLCKVRGIRHEKNFKGADHYLPGLVSVFKRGRKNTYRLNIEAIEALGTADCIIVHTPAHADNTPAVEGVYTPAGADNTPAQAGANSTSNTKEDSSKETTEVAPVLRTVTTPKGRETVENNHRLSPNTPQGKEYPASTTDSSATDTPATEGVLDRRKKAIATWNHQPPAVPDSELW